MDAWRPAGGSEVKPMALSLVHSFVQKGDIPAVSACAAHTNAIDLSLICPSERGLAADRALFPLFGIPIAARSGDADVRTSALVI